MKVSVVVCTNGGNSLEECLESLEKQTYSDYEIIVVPNVDMENRLEDFNVKRISSNEKNLSVQRNLGIKNSNGDIVAFIDDDAVAKEGWIKNLVKHYQSEDVMCVGGKVVPKYELDLPKNISELDEHIFYGLIGVTYIKWKKSGEIRSPLIWGCNISFRKEVFDEVGYFPSELGRSEDKLMSGEETYLQIKIMNENYKVIYEPDAVVSHIVDQNQLKESYLVKRSFWQGFSDIKRVKLSGDLDNLYRYNNEAEMIMKEKFFQRCFELTGLKNLKDKIDIARELGRISGLSKELNFYENK